jgi:hypothetical protein
MIGRFGNGNRRTYDESDGAKKLRRSPGSQATRRQCRSEKQISGLTGSLTKDVQKQ